MNKKENRKILVILTFLIVLLVALIAYLSYFTFFVAADIKDHPANRRDAMEEAGILRGKIFDRDGNILAYSQGEKYKYDRVYNYPVIYSHILGYSNKISGKAGIELNYNKYLLGKEGSKTIKAIKAFFNRKIDVDAGDDIYLTTNTAIQQKSRELLVKSGYAGAVVVMKPNTGEVLALASYPDFNSQTIDKDYAALVEQNEGALFNRATKSLIAPGSTFKIVTTAAILENGINQQYNDTGEESGGGHAIRNSMQAVYGQVGLQEAFAHSINTYFANKAMVLGNNKMGEMAEKFWFNRSLDFELGVERSYFDYKSWDKQALASAGIGQGDVTATPLEMCMVASTIANGGNMMQPYLVSGIKPSGGDFEVHNEPTIISNVMPEESAEKIKNMMVDVIKYGSGKKAAIRGVKVAGKTGTAQKNVKEGINNAWFVGFAPADNPEICVSIVIQDVKGYGGSVAGPIAGELMSYALEEMKE